MNGNRMIYIIDDNQYGELSKACGYIEAGIYNDVVRWVKPSKETKVEDFHDAACICYHSSFGYKRKWCLETSFDVVDWHRRFNG